MTKRSKIVLGIIIGILVLGVVAIALHWPMIMEAMRKLHGMP